ncbi:MAG: acetyl-CoA carboxylase biotin carboxylase subunit [Bdellovibrionales bacterium]|nr:acetyl-CoA carboxylase biotin carboxylase subunit [Bdellovibrionales bacterium]
MPKIKKVLIANRGEIASRIQRSCDALGIASAVTVSDADRSGLFARLAQEVAPLPGSSPFDTYLNIDAILELARKFKCDSIHPGYGFLSENSEFSQRVLDAGLVFIGPNPRAISIMGSKTEARKIVQKHNVPVVPGTAGGLSDEELLSAANNLAFPLLIKAVGGGGGRGMRVVQSLEELKSLLPRARAESKKNFANEDVFLERYIEKPRHVEVQVLGDSHGNLIHLGTRDCSTQRRHQKLIEEAPAPFLSEEVRSKIHVAAINAAKSVGYDSAGTVELLVKGEEFFFLEMNTRIQVEHPVTEEVTATDLVSLQIRVAQGEKLPFQQSDVHFDGHSIELRVYAEDPAQDFRPSLGTVTKIDRPECEFLREDHSLEEGTVVSPYYDAMLSKLIVKGRDRKEALEQLRMILSDYEIEGIETNLNFHRWLLCLSPFVEAPVDIHFVGREFSPACLEQLRALRKKDPEHRASCAGAEYVERLQWKRSLTSEIIEVEVVHRSDGYFLARPISGSGERASAADCRISNGKTACLNALISEVLEKKTSNQLFAFQRRGSR